MGPRILRHFVSRQRWLCRRLAVCGESSPDRACKYLSAGHSAVIQRGERTWLVRVYVGRDQEPNLPSRQSGPVLLEKFVLGGNTGGQLNLAQDGNVSGPSGLPTIPRLGY